jgi:hypothetical protein
LFYYAPIFSQLFGYEVVLHLISLNFDSRLIFSLLSLSDFSYRVPIRHLLLKTIQNVYDNGQHYFEGTGARDFQDLFGLAEMVSWRNKKPPLVFILFKISFSFVLF